MASYLNLFKRGIERKLLIDFLIKLPKINIDVIICSPGGCANRTLNNYLEKFCISNNFLTKNYNKIEINHLPRPLKLMIKRKIKIILIKRDFDEIYLSHKRRGFLRNSLIWYGDAFSFYKFKNELYLKKKFIKYLEKFYQSWTSYPNLLKLEVEFNNLWTSAYNIKNFLNIKNDKFVEEFPQYDRD